MRPKPTFLRLLLPVFFLFSAVLPTDGAPAFRGQVNLRQPDGTLVSAFLTGDEHGHLVFSPDGCALVQDAEGWWCYAIYDFYGNCLNSGERAGLPDTPGEILAASRNIPYDLLQQRRNRRLHKMERLQQRQLARTRSLVSDGTSGGVRHGLIILAQFQDLSFTFTHDDFEQVINGIDPKSALSYFKDQWKDGYEFRFDITDIITLPGKYADYGANDDEGQDKNPAQMIVDACQAIDDEVDFSAYDNDGDGEVDNVFVFYAGPNESEGAGANYIWPHMWYVLSGAGITYMADGVLVDNYACTSEMMLDANRITYTTLASIGTFCHEYTHTFGIPDLYDTDSEGSGGYSEAIWNYIDLMDAGNYNDRGRTPPNYSAVERWFFGMSEGRPFEEGTFTLRPIEENGDFLIYEVDEGELYLFECRNAKGWDAYIGGNGLLIYHIDHSERPAGESTSAKKTVTAMDRWVINEVNANPVHQCVDLIEPDPDARQHYQNAVKNLNYDAIYTLASHAFWPFGEQSVFNSETNPAFRFWNGNDSTLGIEYIRLNADGSVSFTVFNDLEEKAPAVKLDDILVFQDAAILQWSSVDPSFAGNSYISFGLADENNLTEKEVHPYETGKYACVLEGLEPTTAYKVKLQCRNGAIPGPENNSVAFTTKLKSGSYPYIYLKNVERGLDGSIPADAPLCLRVYNASDADGVRWYFDGQQVFPGDDGYWHIPHSGVLKAVVSYPESTDVITKEIVVK